MADALYINAVIYTSNPLSPYAEAMAVKHGKIIYVGSTNNLEKQYKADSVVDLKSRFVMPGIIDAHAHPGLVAMIGELDTLGFTLPTNSKEVLFEALKQYAIAHAEDPFINLGDWDVGTFLPDGPNKKDLDAILPDKPVILTDNSGHSSWLNSKTLAMFGIDQQTPDLSSGVSMTIRDENGQATGWIKEFQILDMLAESLLRPKPELKERMKYYLNYLSAHGVTMLWDAGNFILDEEIYSVLQELDQENALPMGYEGSYHIYDPRQIDFAIDELLKLRGAYTETRLKFNSIKIHFDGVVEIGTAGVLEGYELNPESHGGYLFSAEQLATFIIELQKHDIDLHLHSVGDAATREILNAVELARSTSNIEIGITICHLEHVNPHDFSRFAKLDVHANFTPHWWGCTFFGNIGEMQMGYERIYKSQPASELWSKGANVTFSSDVTTLSNHHRANPFVGIQMSLTRQEFDKGSNAPIFGPKTARLSLDQSITAYTIHGARQLGKENIIGSLEVGKQADFIILEENIFNMNIYKIHNLKPKAVFVEGLLESGEL